MSSGSDHIPEGLWKCNKAKTKQTKNTKPHWTPKKEIFHMFIWGSRLPLGTEQPLGNEPKVWLAALVEQHQTLLSAAAHGSHPG